MLIDFAEEGLLDGLEGEPERTARIELLERLLAEGATLEELKEAAAGGRLVLLPVERALARGDGPYDLDEVAERSALETDAVRRVRASFGVSVPSPGERVLGEADVAEARRLHAALELGLGEERVLSLNRVIGQAMAQIAATMVDTVGAAFIRPGDNERDLAFRYAQAVGPLLPMAGPVLEYALTQHLREHLSRTVLTHAELMSGRLVGATDITVCFADLVGFTELGQRIPAEGLGAIAERLAELAGDAARPPVSLVKTIGDAAMLVSDDARRLLDAVLTLVDRAGAQTSPFPQLHAGIAAGPAVQRGGDWFGQAVNLASRVCDLASRRSVFATTNVKDAIGDSGYEWVPAGAHRIKGVVAPVTLWQVHRKAP